ncbi:uncharacterized protein LOC143072901 [Mytilus galloprovincialis]|uniref:uncharacterized protein LOC143072901 n=1 Tax=Mytilus galloprovincialis TaxID=29158 RepID=UPI003F7C5D7C
MLLKPRGSYVNSLSSIVYCVIATLAQCYICYSYLGPYETTLDEKWSGTYRSGYGVRLGLPIIGLFVLPLFILFSVFRVGNYANDGFKIGRDHALTAQTNFFGDRFERELTRRVWRNFCPFAPTLHLFIAFSLILPDTILTGLDVKYGHQNSDAVWSTDVDFLYSKDRPLLTDHVVRLNATPTTINLTIHPLYTTSNNGGYRPSAAFVYFLSSLATYAIRYASVFWYTNKYLSMVFVFQLLFMSVNSIFSYSGFSILYKIALNSNLYGNINLNLGCGSVIFLFIVSGIVLILSSFAVFEYGFNKYYDKYKLVDRRHNPQIYTRKILKDRGPCNGHIAHTFAMITLVLLAIFKGPILYDLISVYRTSKDTLVLTTVIIEVCYLVFWIFLWTIFTIKETWLFRILDYANVGQPIFVIKSNNLTRTPSISIASIDIKDLSLPMVKPKRPGSIQSMDITPSESGYDEGETAPSTEDEKFGISLPPLREYDEHMDQNDVILRRSRNRRSGGQRVTFHDNVRGSLSTEALNESQRSKSPMSEDMRMNVTADIHSGSRNKYVRRSSDPDAKRLRNNRHNCHSVPRQNCATDKQFNHELADYIANIQEITQNHRETSVDDGEKCEIEVDYLSPNRNRPEKRPRTPQGQTPERVILRHSGPKNSREQTPEKILNKNLVNKFNRNSDPETTKNNKTEELANNKNVNKAKKGEIISNEDKQLQKQNNDFFTRSEKPDIVPNENRSQVYPRPIKFVPKKPDNIRRDSANYSQTSSQDTSSNDSSEQTTLFSQEEQKK